MRRDARHVARSGRRSRHRKRHRDRHGCRRAPTQVGASTPISIVFGPGAIFPNIKPSNVSLSSNEELMFLEAGFQVWLARKLGDGGYSAELRATQYGHPFFDEPRSRLFATRYLDDAGGDVEQQELVLGQVDGSAVGTLSPIGARSPAYAPVPSPDGGGVYFTASGVVTAKDVFFTALPAVADADVPVANVNGATADAPTWLSADGCRLYLISGRKNIFKHVYLSRRGRRRRDRYERAARRRRRRPAEQPVGRLRRPQADGGRAHGATDPIPSPDGDRLYFAADVPLRQTDIFSTPLPVTPDAATPLPNVSSATIDSPQWISRDGCRLYLLSSRDSAFGRVYVAERGR